MNLEEIIDTKAPNISDAFSVAKGVWGLKDIFVNVFFVQSLYSDDWILIDAGLKTSASKIKKTAAKLFGADSKPQAILLTHGHFDHVGSLVKLSEEWDVPVYAHRLEKPYLTGADKYPPADPTTGGGMMTYVSFLYPRTGADVSSRLQIFNEDGTIPFLGEWQYIHTPGHAPGHVSFFRKSDSVLIAGDAFVTTVQESAMAILFQYKHVNGPPKYFTIDWEKAKQSVQKLNRLHPEIIATGHGMPVSGSVFKKQLSRLANHFDEIAKPANGRYVNQPALTDEEGVTYIPPAKSKIKPAYVLVGIAAVITGVLATRAIRSRRNRFIEEYN